MHRKLVSLTLIILLVQSSLYSVWAQDIKPIVTEKSTSSVPSQTETTNNTQTIQNDEKSSDEAKSLDTSQALSQEKPQNSAPTVSGTPEPNYNTLGQVAQSKLPKVEPDEASGALTYDFPITVTPGRNNLQPDVHLTYNSQANDNSSIVGTGWALNIPSIERINRKGADKLYVENYFNSSLSGELVLLYSSTYGSKVDNGEFLDYVLLNNSWVARDKKGIQYKFGVTANARQDNPSDPTRIYKWMLEEIRDTNNNYVKYEYYKSAGQIYPSRIVYTGNGSTDGPFEVIFNRTIGSSEVSYRPGFSVTDTYRISSIQTKISGTLSKQYDLSYLAKTVSLPMLLLSSITETGYSDGDTSVSRTTSFNYSESTTARAWAEDTSWVVPSDVNFGRNDPHYGWRIVDLNGDSLPDFIRCDNCDIWGNTKIKKTYLNTGSGWTESAAWSVPTGLDSHWDAAFFIDINGDGLTDVFTSKVNYDAQSNSKVYLNTGSTWLLSTSWSVPTDIILPTISDRDGSPTNNNTGWILNDINGDGLPDFVQALIGSGADQITRKVYLNTGSGWSEDTVNFRTPYDTWFGSNYPQPYNYTLADINNDSLPDIVEMTYQTAYLNTGTGWLQTAMTFPTLSAQDSSFDRGNRMLDADGDGYPDFVRNLELKPCCDPPNYFRNTFINQHPGWANSTIGPLVPIDMLFYSNLEIQPEQKVFPHQFADVNGDGEVDIINAYLVFTGPSSGDQVRKVLINNSMKPGLLTSITYPTGGHVDVAYKPTAQYASWGLLNPNLPLILNTVSQISQDSGLGMVSTTTYQYEGGKYYFATPFDRKFSGFERITKTDTQGNVTRSYYHQGDSSNAALGEYNDYISKVGKPYRIELYDANSNLYSTTINKWENVDLGSGRNFVKLIQTLNQTFDGNATHRDKAESYGYDDSTGNLIQKIEWGEVQGSDDGTFKDIGTDKYTTDTAYTSNTTSHIIGLPVQDTVTDQSSNKVKESKYYYDNLPVGLADKGNLTQEDDWKSDLNYINTKKSYDSYGLVIEEKDPRGYLTKYTYDDFNLYPSIVTNALEQSTHYLYDYASGKTKQVTDANNHIFQIIYDGFGRIIEERQPDLNDPATLVKKAAYTYSDIGIGSSVKQTEYLDDTVSNDTYTYFDGLGRTIQIRKQAEDVDTFSITDSLYNNLGLLYKQSLPYFSSGSARTTPTNTSALYSAYAYDPMQRVISVSSAVGTTKNTYDDRQLNIIDANGKVKDLFKDAYDRLIQVNEHDGSLIYITTYAYNGLGNLIKITDANGNIRNFTYDGLGRRLSAEDLHYPVDLFFGTWAYSYDDSDNLITKLDPKQQKISYTYDPLNRVRTEDFEGQPGVEVTYGYDTCADGVGRLCSVVTNSLTQQNTYNPLGLISSEDKLIDTVNYHTAYSYNRLGNLTVLSNPDQSQVKYDYNSAGLLEKVSLREHGASQFTSIVDSFDYSPQGQITVQNYFNGAQTTNTYDDARLYRLQHKVTVLPPVNGMTPVTQDLAYNYDNVGNIKRITDKVDSETTDYTYDDLYRLKQAVIKDSKKDIALTQSYSYNAIGNFTSKFEQDLYTYQYAGNLRQSYANPHAVTDIKTRTGRVSYQYDNNGNLLTAQQIITDYLGNVRSVSGGMVDAWDYNNRLALSTVPGRTSTYAYDQNGQRIKHSIGQATTVYPSRYYNVTGSTVTKHVFAGDELTATVNGSGTNAIIYSVHTDHLTGSNVISNANGQIEEVTKYYPFGDIRSEASQSGFSEQRKFAGHEYDWETGLSYMNARYYKPAVGRFISQDPLFLDIGLDVKKYNKQLVDILIDPQALNSYSYVENNPVTKVDPTGKASMRAWFNLNSLIPLRTLGRTYVTASIELGGLLFNRPFSSTLLGHSLSINPQSISITEANQRTYGNPIDQIKSTWQYKDLISKSIANAEKGIYQTKAGYEFTEGDLSTSIGKFDAQVNVAASNGRWDLNIVIKDTYNFDSYRAGQNPASLLNNWGYKSQMQEVITQYPISINFHDHKDKK